jgi:hypothetical protein
MNGLAELTKFATRYAKAWCSQILRLWLRSLPSAAR